jgi:hypothetical protein
VPVQVAATVIGNPAATFGPLMTLQVIGSGPGLVRQGRLRHRRHRRPHLSHPPVRLALRPHRGTMGHGRRQRESRQPAKQRPQATFNYPSWLERIRAAENYRTAGPAVETGHRVRYCTAAARTISALTSSSSSPACWRPAPT